MSVGLKKGGRERAKAALRKELWLTRKERMA